MSKDHLDVATKKATGATAMFAQIRAQMEAANAVLQSGVEAELQQIADHRNIILDLERRVALGREMQAQNAAISQKLESFIV